MSRHNSQGSSDGNSHRNDHRNDQGNNHGNSFGSSQNSGTLENHEKHIYPLKIVKSYIDAYGHVNNAIYLSLFEDARWDMISSRGYGRQIAQERGVGPAILEIHLRFRKELLVDQEVQIESQVQSVRRKIAIVHQEIRDPQNTLYCSADFTFGLFDLRARKLVMPTPEWLEALGIRTETKS